MYISTNAFDISKSGFVTIPDGNPGYRELTTYSEVTSFAQRERFKKIVVTIPERLLTIMGDKAFLPDWKPYKEEFSTSIAKMVAPAWGKRAFGFIPGDFQYDADAVLHFYGELEPSKNGTDALLFYADASMKGYAGTHGATSFRFGTSNFYGIILPLNYVTAKKTVCELRSTMEKSLRQVIA